MKQADSQIVLKYNIQVHRPIQYPFYPVFALFSLPELDVVFVNEDFSILVMGFKSDFSKLPGKKINLPLSMRDRTITAIKVLSVSIGPNKYALVLQKCTFLVGYLSGELVAFSYQQSEPVTVLQRFNRKAIEEEGFFSKLLLDEIPYQTFSAGAVNRISLHESVYTFSYQAANRVFLMTQVDQSLETELKQVYLSESHHGKSFLIKKGPQNHQLFISKSILMLEMEGRLCSYEYNDPFLYVMGCYQEKIFKYSTENGQVLEVIYAESPLRKINLIFLQNRPFLVVFPERDSYFLVDCLGLKFCKISGHKSFISDVRVYQGQITSCGMDHRICCLFPKEIYAWNSLLGPGKRLILADSIPKTKIQNVFSLGEYNNARTMQHDFGFACLGVMPRMICLATFQSSIKLFRINL